MLVIRYKPVWQVQHVLRVRRSAWLWRGHLTRQARCFSSRWLPKQSRVEKFHTRFPKHITEDRERKWEGGREREKRMTCRQKMKVNNWGLKGNRRAEAACWDGKLKRAAGNKERYLFLSAFLMPVYETKGVLHWIQSGFLILRSTAAFNKSKDSKGKAVFQ